MKHFITIFFLLFALSTSCLSQNKRKLKEKEIKTDTIDVFQRLDNKIFKEKNIFWLDKGEVGIIQSQRFNDPTSVDEEYELNFTIIFDNWDLVEPNKSYNLIELRTECELNTMFGGESFKTPTGNVKLISKTKEKLTFHFDINVMSDNKDKFLIYSGYRDFRPDY
jgi:hypothetical protein